jgi:hypothetical protein
MPTYQSDIATKQDATILRGPIVGSHGIESGGKLHFLDDKYTFPSSTTVATTDRLRFGKLPAGSKLLPGAVTVTSTHSATVAGSFYLTQTDNITNSTAVPGGTINLEATTTGTLLDNQDYPVLTKDCWLEFGPTASTTFASGVVVRARIGYLLNS